MGAVLSCDCVVQNVKFHVSSVNRLEGRYFEDSIMHNSAILQRLSVFSSKTINVLEKRKA